MLVRSLAGDPLTAEDVSELIADEIAAVGADWLTRPENNPHGLDLSRCLVKLERALCTNPFPGFRDGKPFEARLVLEELPKPIMVVPDPVSPHDPVSPQVGMTSSTRDVGIARVSGLRRDRAGTARLRPLREGGSIPFVARRSAVTVR